MPKGLRRVEPAETSTDDDDVRAFRQSKASKGMASSSSMMGIPSRTG